MPVFEMDVRALTAHAQTVTASLVHVTLVNVVRAVAQSPVLCNLLHVRRDVANQLLKHVQVQTAHAKVASVQTAMVTPVLVTLVNV